MNKLPPKALQTKGQILTKCRCVNADLFRADTGIQPVNSPALALPKSVLKLHVYTDAEQWRCPTETAQKQGSLRLQLRPPLNSVFASLLSEHTQFRQLSINSINHLLFWSGRAGTGLLPTRQPGCTPTIMPKHSARQMHLKDGFGF